MNLLLRFAQAASIKSIACRPAESRPRAPLRSGGSSFLILLVAGCTAFLSAPASAQSARPGGERVISREPETGRTIWRMTVSKTNDKHCYSDESGICQVYIVVIDEARVRARFGDGAIHRK